ncbi:MAG: DUF1353 domain-containing protein [Parvularculaceae bacterium]|nr:DUF1353 domain-containing protein [Parvularculaceae bacterium]
MFRVFVFFVVVAIAGVAAFYLVTGEGSESESDQGQAYAKEWKVSDPRPSAPGDDTSEVVDPTAYLNSTQRGRPVALAPLRVANDAKRRLWATLEPTCYQVSGAFADSEQVIRVYIPRGFRTDLASIPAVGRVVLNPADYAEAALVHDFLYALGIEGQRARADAWFLRALDRSGIEDRPARLMHQAVRFGGESGYGRDDEITAVWDFATSQLRGVNEATINAPRRAQNLELTEAEIIQQTVLCSIRRAYGLKQGSGRRNRRRGPSDSDIVADCFTDQENWPNLLAGTLQQLDEACPGGINLFDRPALARQLGLVGEGR